MNILRRAWWGVSRRRNQSLILLLILLVIGTLVIASLSIQFATEQAKQDARKASGSEVILKSYGGTGGVKMEFIPLNLAESLSTNDYMEGYNYVSHWSYAGKSFQAVPGETNYKMEIVVTGPDADDFKMPDLAVDAITDTSKLKEFKNGVYTLEEGRHITEESGSQPFVLIERTLAEENDLHIGDKLIMTRVDGFQIETEIIGIYRTTQTVDDVRINMNMPTVLTQFVPYNKIYIPFNALPLTSLNTNETAMHEAIYSIDDPMHVSSFVKLGESNPLFDPDVFKFYSSENKLMKMSLAIDKVASFSSVMLWTIIISGTIILCLLFIYFVKGRLREMGVLLSLGESRFKLITQLIVESMFLVIIAFSISIFSGNFAAKQASHVLLEQQQAAIEKEIQLQIQGASKLSGQGDGQEAMINTLEIKLSNDIWLRLVYVTCFILIISIVFPAVLIFRLKPTALLALQE